MTYSKPDGRLAVLLVALVLLTATGSPAAEQKKNDYIGLFFGAGFGDEELTGNGQSNKAAPLFGLRWDHYICQDRSFFADVNWLDYDSTLPIGDMQEASARVGLQKLFGRPDGSNWFVEGGPGFYDLDPELAESKRGLSLNVGFGQQFLLGPRATVYRWEIRPELLSDSYAPGGQGTLNVELTLGWSWGVGGTFRDADGDGIFDCVDQCADTVKGALVDERGCPRDSDGDGVYDGIDRCPDTPKGFAVDAQGCPKDADRDGVSDGADRCPDTPAGAKVDAQGCPLDADGDGVYDGIDQCPDTPRGAKVDAKGCPLDTDGDGVYDGLDRCPDTPRGTKVDATGCPLPETKAAPIFEPGKNALVLEGVNFEVNKAALTPDSTAILDKVAASLRDWPEVRVEVGGHTDSDGSNAYNLKLSQRRADAVMQYLADHGIATSRMTAKGYGESRPISDDKAKNRRVELTKLD